MLLEAGWTGSNTRQSAERRVCWIDWRWRRVNPPIDWREEERKNSSPSKE
jgi:hypothetical protein